MQPTNSVEPPYQYMMIDGCKVKVNYLPKPSAPSAGKVLDRIHEILLTSLDKGTQRKTTENELPSLTQCTA